MGAGGSTQRRDAGGGVVATHTRAASSRRVLHLPTTPVPRDAVMGINSIGGVLYMRSGCDSNADRCSPTVHTTRPNASSTTTPANATTSKRSNNNNNNNNIDDARVVYAWMVQDATRPGQWAMYTHESQARLEAAYTAGDDTCLVAHKQHTYVVDLTSMTQHASSSSSSSSQQQQQQVCCVRRVRATTYVDADTHEVCLREVRDGFVDPFADDMLGTADDDKRNDDDNDDDNAQADNNNNKRNDVAMHAQAATTTATAMHTTSPNECNSNSNGHNDATVADGDALPRLLRKVQAHTEALFCLGVAHDTHATTSPSSAAVVLTAGVGNTMREWAIDTSAIVRSYNVQSTRACGYVLSARYAHDAPHRIVAACDDMLARVFVVADRSSGDGGSSSRRDRGSDGKTSEVALQPQQRLRGHTHKVYDADFVAHSGGGKVVTASMDGTVRVWDVANAGAASEARCERTELCSHSHLFSLALSHTQPHLALSCGNDALVNVHDFRRPHSVALRLAGHTRTLWCCALREPDGEQALSCGMDGTVCVWDVRAPHDAVHVMRHHTREVHHVAYTPRARGVLSCGKDGRVVLADAATGEAVWRATSHTRPAFRLAVHAASQSLLTCSMDGAVHVWQWPACDAW